MDSINFEKLQRLMREFATVLATVKPSNTRSTKTAFQDVIDLVDAESEKLRRLYREHILQDMRQKTEAKVALATLASIIRLPKTVDAPLTVVVNIGVDIQLPLLPIDKVPLMRYAAIRMRDGHVLVVYKHTASSIISIGNLSCTDTSVRAVSCSNAKCTYGDACRYYHDPILGESKHQQTIPKSYMVRGCPHFGDQATLTEDLKSLTFVQVRTLARYAATLNLYCALVERAV